MSGPRPSDKGALDAASTTRLTVDLGAIARNRRSLAKLAAGAECAAVVKADAYGLGVAEVVPALSRAGCRTFFVATVTEGADVRRLAPDATIYVLNGPLPGSEAAFLSADLKPVISSLAQAESWIAHAKTHESPEAALHIDTGMNRLGLNPSEFEALDIEQLQPELLISHLACADDPRHDKNQTQLEALAEITRRFPGIAVSLANSAGILLGTRWHFDMVRPGIALYGGRPSPFAPSPVEPVVTFEARIVQIRTAEAGETVGYGAGHTVKQPIRLAIVAAGYADGYLRAAGSSDVRQEAVAHIGEWPAPVMGRISMDLIALDVTHIPEHAIRPGEWVELIGPHVTVDDLAAAAGTIAYEILTGVGRRAERRYVGV